MMAHKCTVLGMLVSLHSLGLIFASLFTYKWYVDNSRDIGIFGICEYLNATSINKFINVNANANMHNDSWASAGRMNTAAFEAQKMQAPPTPAVFVESTTEEFKAEPNQTTPMPAAFAEALVSPKETTTSKTYTLLTYSKIYQKCYQLLWPESDDAFEYLASIAGCNILAANLKILTL